MDELEVRKIFFFLQNSYNGFDGEDDAKVAIWQGILQEVPFERAKENLLRYIRNPANQFPPHPGVLAATAVQLADGPYVPNAEETRRMLAEQDAARLAAPRAVLTDEIRERMKKLGKPKPSIAGTGSDV